MVNIISFSKDFLVAFKYPLIDSMSGGEIADVFNKSNRCFLISWLLKLLGTPYLEILVNMDKNEVFLANLLYECGFCKQKESLSFMKGESPIADQLNILHRIFIFIKDIRENIEDKNKVSREEIEILKAVDLNLFPLYGDIKVNRSDLKEKDDFKEEFEKESLESSGEDVLIKTQLKEDIYMFIKELEEKCPKTVDNIRSICVENKAAESNELLKVPSSFPKLLESCNEGVEKILQFIKNMQTISDFEKLNILEESKTTQRNDIGEMAMALFEEMTF